MPELPEVETTVRGLSKLLGQRILSVELFHQRLRTELDKKALQQLAGTRISAISRRAKYILFDFDNGQCLLAHLGMSGGFAIVPKHNPRRKHEHVIFQLQEQDLRYHDPRRFGLLELFADRQAALASTWLASLGPEPLEQDFNSRYMLEISKGRSTPLKVHLMNPKIVVGIGNIYASEALFQSGILPQTPAGALDEAQWAVVVAKVREILALSIEKGGTTLRDFSNTEGKMGYFQQSLWVYGRANQPCQRCQNSIMSQTMGQRSTFWCPHCQH